MALVGMREEGELYLTGTTHAIYGELEELTELLVTAATACDMAARGQRTIGNEEGAAKYNVMGFEYRFLIEYLKGNVDREAPAGQEIENGCGVSR